MAVVDRVREVVASSAQLLRSFPSGPGTAASSPRTPAFGWSSADGRKRLLAGYREASWSPFGRFLVATGANELAALEPDGGVRWTLSRPGVRHARWGGTEVDTRIAYRRAASSGSSPATEPATAPSDMRSPSHRRGVQEPGTCSRTSTARIAS